jgi:hypothetical protein
MFFVFVVVGMVVGYEHVGVFKIGDVWSFYGFCCGW